MQNSERSTRSTRKFIPEPEAPPDPESASESGQFLCMECSETFDSRLELNSHRQSHVTKKQFTCSHCGRGFHHQVFLQMHERSHEDGVQARASASRVICTRSSKMSDAAYSKPPRLLNSLVEFKNEQNVCQTFPPRECVTRRSHGTVSSDTQKRDVLEKNLFELRISKFSDTTVHLMDSFGNSIEILADVFNSYAIREENEENGESAGVEDGLLGGGTPTNDTSPSRDSPDHIPSDVLAEQPSGSAQTNPSQPSESYEGGGALPPSSDPAPSVAEGSGLPVPSDADGVDAPREEEAENRFGPAETPADEKSRQPSSEETVSCEQAGDSAVVGNHVGTSPEEAAAHPTSPWQPQGEPEVCQTERRSPAAMQPSGSEDPPEDSSSIIELPAKLPNTDQSLRDDPGSCRGPETSEEHEQPGGFPQQNAILLEAEIGKVLLPPADAKEGLPTDTPPQSPGHPGPEGADLSLLVNRDVKEEESAAPASTKELGALSNEATFALPPAGKQRIDVSGMRPDKHDLKSEESAAKNTDLEAALCGTSQEDGEVPSPETNLQMEGKDPAKHCSLLGGQDILDDQELVMDDKRDEDLFERDIFPLGAPMEVCEKGLASMEEPSLVCGPGAHSAKLLQQKESDICLNGSDMTYISESEMIKLLEQDKDDMADDEPITADLGSAGAELANHTKESKSTVSWDGEGPAGGVLLTSKPSTSPARLEEVQHYDRLTSENDELGDVPTFQTSLKEKIDTDSCLPAVSLLTNDEPRTGTIEPQDHIQSLLTPDMGSRSSLNGQADSPEISSSSNLQQMTKEGNPEVSQSKPEKHQYNEPCGSSTQGVDRSGRSTMSGAENTHERGTPEENMNVFVTVEDNECEDSSSQEKPLSSIQDDKGLGSAIVSSVKPEQTTKSESASGNMQSVQNAGTDPEREAKVQTQEMAKPPIDVVDDIQRTSNYQGDHSSAASSAKTELKTDGTEGKLVEQTFLLKSAEKGNEMADPGEATRDLPSETDRSSAAENVESKENPSEETETKQIGDVEDSRVVGERLEQTSVASPKAMEGDDSETKQNVPPPGKPVSQDVVQEPLEDSELVENNQHKDADDFETAAKPMGAGGECLKCGRKLRRGRKELVWLPLCFKCRMAAKKQKRLSNQGMADGLNLSLDPLVARRRASLPAKFSASRIKQAGDGRRQDDSKDPSANSDPSADVEEKETPASAAKKMYKCPKCDEAFRIPALLAGHIKCHTLPQCLTCGCQMRLKYKTKRIPRRCQKCFQRLKEKMRAEKAAGEGSGDEESGSSDNEDVAVSPTDVNPDDDDDDDDVSDEDSCAAERKTNRTPLKKAKSGLCDPSRRSEDDVLVLSDSPEGHAGHSLYYEERGSFRKNRELSKKQRDSCDELDIGDQNLGLADGEKPRLCPQCGKAFKCNRSLNLHLLSHSGIQCESCGCRLPKKRRVGRWSKKCRGCRLQIKGKLLNDSEDEMSLPADTAPKQKNAASLRLKTKPSKIVKNTKIQSIMKKKKELKWMNMLLAVKGLMDKSRKKKESALQAADSTKRDTAGSEAEKCDASSADNSSDNPDHPVPEKAGPSKIPSGKALSDAPKQGRKCLYREKNIVKVEENELMPYIPSEAGSISTAFIKQEEMWQCLECNQSWPNAEALINHQHSHISDQPFTCPQCPQIFSSEEYLNIHIHAHDEDRPFRCPECDKTFTKRNHLGVHMRVHSGARPYACPECPCRFRQKVTLIAHRYSHRNYQLLFTKPFQCSVCNKSFKQKERLVVHERLHTGECPFSCKDCDEVFPSKARLYVHRKMHKMCDASSSSGEQNLTGKEVTEGQPFKCQECGKICSTKASFVLHCKVHRLSSMPLQSIKREQNDEAHPFSCRVCDKAFSSKASLAMHLKNHSAHRGTTKPEMSLDLKECFTCKVCDKVCSTKASLALHRKVHKSPSGDHNLVIKVESDPPSYVCKHCNKICSTKASLVLHCKVHKSAMGSETPPFRCKECDMVCSTKASFVLHRKVHRSSSSGRKSPKAVAGPQSYNCKHCDMICSTKASFVLHSKVHKSPSIGEQQLKGDPELQLYNCKYCDMVCSTKASFVLHSKVHQSTDSEQSLKAAEEPQSYSCKHCDMVCSTKASFVLHSKVHRSLFSADQLPKTSEDPQPYNCKHCDMVCSTKASFVLHSKVHRSSSAGEEPQSYSCTECDMVCSTKASLVIHSKVHGGEQSLRPDPEENPYTCKDCNKVCSTKASFVLHRKVHKEHNPSPRGERGAERPFLCNECGKTFTSKGRLLAHSRLHDDSSSLDQNTDHGSDGGQPKKASEEKAFSCTTCGLRFIKLKMLVRHKAVHGERTVTPCIHCGKQFLYMKSLFNHIKICQNKSKGKKLLLKKAAKRKIPKDGGSTSSEGEGAQKKRKLDDKQKAMAAARRLKNKNLKAKKVAPSKEKGKGRGAGDPKTKERPAKVDGEAVPEGDGKKSAGEKLSDGRQEKPSEAAAREPTHKKNVPKIKAKKEPSKVRKVPGGPRKWRVLAASTVKKKNLQALLIGGKKKLLMKKKVQLKPKSGGKVGKD